MISIEINSLVQVTNSISSFLFYLSLKGRYSTSFTFIRIINDHPLTKLLKGTGCFQSLGK